MLLPSRTPDERAALAWARERLDWQVQERGWRMPASYLHGYRGNPYEAEAREAVTATRAAA